MKKVKLTTTLNLLREHDACAEGYRKLVKHIGADYPKDKPINLLTILKSNGVQDMMWCLRATEQGCLAQRYLISADVAESVLHIFITKYPSDDRPAKAIQAARDAAAGKIQPEKARVAAYAADAAAAYAADAAAAAYAAYAAANAADAAYTAADAAYAAADAAYAAADAAYAAANAARDKERKKQAEIIRKYLAER